MPGSIPLEAEPLLNDAIAFAGLDVIGALRKMIGAFATSRTAQQILALAEEVGKGPAQEQALAAHQKLADAMRDSAIRSLGQAKRQFRRAKFGTVYDPERLPPNRYPGGLDKILHDQGLIEVTATGVRFGDVALMDREARHWARLNFGAGGAGQGSSERFGVTFSNLGEIQYGFEFPARPGYTIPRGFWKGGSPRGGAFYPGRFFGKNSADIVLQKGPQQTKGNVGYQFLDAGVARFFKELPQVYGDLIKATVYTTGRPASIRTRGFGEKRRFTA